MLLEKSNGTFELVIWNGKVQIGDNNGPVTPQASTIQVNLGQAASSIQLFDPIRGTTATTTLHNASTVTFQLSADPIVVEIQMASSPTAPHLLAHHASDMFFV